MYEDYYYQGKSLPQWRDELKGSYSLGELYRMAKDGCDLSMFVLRENGLATLED